MMTVEEVLNALRTDAARGLDEKEAAERLARFGPNRPAGAEPASLWRVFLNRLRYFPVLGLLAAAALWGFWGQNAGAAAVAGIVIIKAFLESFREYRAGRFLGNLKSLAPPQAVVIRGGRERKIDALGLVPGDIVSLEAGGRVPADIRITEAVGLKIADPVPTGDPAPADKRTGPVAGGAANPWDMPNMACLGATVTGGRGRGVVVATGMAAGMFHAAVMSGEAGREETPLKRLLDRQGRWLAVVCLTACAAVAVMGVFRGEPLHRMIMAGLSLAAAFAPRGLPAIAAVSLAAGARRMSGRNVIPRELRALEALGRATAICCDKTGVLTRNEMAVRKVLAGSVEAEISGDGYDPRGEIKFVRGGRDQQFDLLLRCAALCNNSSLFRDEIKIGGFFRGIASGRTVREWDIRGDPTEGALLVMAARGGIWRERLERHESRVAELPFDPDRKCMTVICRDRSGKIRAYTKGAPAVLLELCTHRFRGSMITPLSEKDRLEILAACSGMAGRGLRVLAFACRDLAGEREDYRSEEKDLTFIGLCGMTDPPRPDAAGAVRVCGRAGIHVAVITGDHHETARAAAAETGLLARGGRVITGREMDALTDGELARQAGEAAVYAEISPRHKLRIVRALKQAGNVVAVTGGGLEDIPALKEADIGMAMGIRGADAAREAAPVILADDSFSTAVAAVEEGRGICSRFRRHILYLLSCSAGGLLVMLLAAAGGSPLPLLPVQILWVSLITGVLPDAALEAEPADRDIMDRPGHPGEGLDARGLLWRAAGCGLIAALVTLAVFRAVWLGSGKIDLARTAAFDTLVFSLLFLAFACRSERHSMLELGLFTNPKLTLAVLSSAVIQAAVTALPLLQPIFHTVSLNAVQWCAVAAAAALPAAAVTALRHILVKAGRIFAYLRA
ncbi:MAG: cation-transporting P-type ATPase [Peptococcaceae bacterium]|nr:cation-transporting P-type ATPase [Peptococcaceae bacterium]